MMLVAGGMGVSIVPAHVADSVPGTLRIVPIPDLTEEIPVVVAFQRDSQNSMLPAFLNVLKDSLELRISNSVLQKTKASSVAKSL
jgi:DNA-binding transcriptional LysR family regulator